jgi:hypothetical protein
MRNRTVSTADEELTPAQVPSVLVTNEQVVRVGHDLDLARLQLFSTNDLNGSAQ